MQEREIIDVSGCQVHLWRLALDAHDTSEDLPSVLSADERDRAARFHDDVDRKRWATGRAALRKILGTCTATDPGELRFQYDEFGKPALAGTAATNAPSFNMSRSQGFGLCVVARCAALGVDLQRIPDEPATDVISRHYCSKEERHALDQVPERDRQSAFCQLWAYKEAYVKARGSGFSLEPDEIAIVPGVDGSARLVRATGEPHPERWALREIRAFPGYRAALALVR